MLHVSIFLFIYYYFFVAAYPKATAGAYVAPPPPMGYPTMDGGAHNQAVAVETKSKGDGFLKGW